MVIQLKYNGPIEDYSMTFLTEAYSMINVFVALEKLLAANPDDHYDEEYRAMGVPLEECMLLCMDACMEDAQIDNLAEISCRGYFGTSLATEKYLKAQTSLEAIYQRIESKIDQMDAYSLKELKQLRTEISYSLGDLIFAFSNIVFEPCGARGILAIPDSELTYSHDLQRFFASIGKTAKELAAELVDLQSEYVSVIPLFEEDPEAWIAITQTLEPNLVDTLVEYGTYITPLDVRAFETGILTIDETFLDILSERAEDPEYIGNVDPISWLNFVKLVPDKHIKTILKLADRLTPGLLEAPLEENKLTDAYVEHLLQFFKEDSTLVQPTHKFD